MILRLTLSLSIAGGWLVATAAPSIPSRLLGLEPAAPPPTAPLRAWSFRIVDAAGDPTAARVALRTPAGAAVVPGDTLSWVMGNQPGRYHGAEYFYTRGEFTVHTAEATLSIYVRKGLEHGIVEQDVQRAEAPTRIELVRAIDMIGRGYYSGDGHIHPVGGEPDWARLPGRRSFHPESDISDELLRTIAEATDLNYSNLLSSNSLGDEVHFRDRVTGEEEPSSDDRHILRVSEEYRSEVYGHMSVFGAAEPSDPVFTALIGSEVSPYDHPTNLEACLKYEADGAFPCFAHLRRQPNIALSCPVDVALGALPAVELQGYAVAPRYAVLLWEKLLGCGFDVVVTAGTDATLTSVNCLPPGGARVYVDLEGRPFTHEHWLAQLAKGRAFTTKGAMLLLRVDGAGPGERLHLEPGTTRTVKVRVEVESLFPWETVILRRNGENAIEFRSKEGNPLRQEFEAELELDGPAWMYAHLAGPLGDHVSGGTNPWWTPTHDAFTNAIAVEVPGRPMRDLESLEFMLSWVEDNRKALEQRDNYGSPENREDALATIDEALGVFRTRLAEARGRPR